jgi:hypothetical protein
MALGGVPSVPRVHPYFLSQLNKAPRVRSLCLDWSFPNMTNRFTEAEKQAALADLKDGMTPGTDFKEAQKLDRQPDAMEKSSRRC